MSNSKDYKAFVKLLKEEKIQMIQHYRGEVRHFQFLFLLTIIGLIIQGYAFIILINTGQALRVTTNLFLFAVLLFSITNITLNIKLLKKTIKKLEEEVINTTFIQYLEEE